MSVAWVPQRILRLTAAKQTSNGLQRAVSWFLCDRVGPGQSVMTLCQVR